MFGICGNVLVAYVVIRKKTMRTITNIFITNLALSDILMCLLAVPFTPLSAFMKQWVFGEVMCHILPMTLGVSVYVSTLTSTAIAVDRYLVILYPFKPRMKTGVCLLIIVIIWIISVSISLPLGIYQKVIHTDHDDTRMCSEHWPHPTARQFFTVTSLLLQYLVPCAIITFCYIEVWRSLSNRTHSMIGTGCRSRDREQVEIRRKKRTNKMLVAMISIFVVCWLPLNALHITSEYKDSVRFWSLYYLIFFIAHVIAMSSTVYNPFLYAWMNESFSKEFRNVLPAFLFRSRHCYNGNNDTTQYTTVDITQSEQRKDAQPASHAYSTHLDTSIAGGQSNNSVSANAYVEKEMNGETTTDVIELSVI